MKNRPFFSIVIPVFNSEKTISGTLENLLKQSFENFEVIIVNDGSLDGTEQILEDIKKRDNRISFINIKNSGPGVARNKGIAQATGEYLLFVDADDKVKENHLEQYYRLLQKTSKSYDLIVSSFRTFLVDNENVISIQETKYPTTEFLSADDFFKHLDKLMEKQLMYVVWNKLYKLNIVKKNNIFFPAYKSCEDRIFNLRYYKHVQNCLVTEKILYDYTFDGKNSLTNKFVSDKFETFVQFYIVAKELPYMDQNIISALFLKGVLSCMISIHSQSNFSYLQKTEYIKKIIYNEKVQNASKISSTNSVLRKVIKFVFLSKSIIINYFVSDILYRTSNLSPKLIEKVKKIF